MDQIPGKHRLVIDTTAADGFRDGLLFASNFLMANRNDYGLQNQDLAVIVVARHLSTGFGFNNDMWAKYGASLGEAPPRTQAKDPPKANPSAAALDRSCEPRRSVRRVRDGDSRACRNDCSRDGRKRGHHLRRTQRESGEQCPHGAGRNRCSQSRAGARIFVRERLSLRSAHAKQETAARAFEEHHILARRQRFAHTHPPNRGGCLGHSDRH